MKKPRGKSMSGFDFTTIEKKNKDVKEHDKKKSHY